MDLSEAFKLAYEALHDVQNELRKVNDSEGRKKAIEMIYDLDKLYAKHFPKPNKDVSSE